MNFNKIKEYCDDQGLSIADLAEKIGVSKPGLYRSIQEESMKVETLEKISEALKVPIWYFFDLDPEKPYISDIEREKNRNKINEETLEEMTEMIAILKETVSQREFTIFQLSLHCALFILKTLNYEGFKSWFESWFRAITTTLKGSVYSEDWEILVSTYKDQTTPKL